MAAGCSARYRARSPRGTPLYRLFETHFDEVRGDWEERFESRYGFWRGVVDEQVRRYIDCGLFEKGFARIRCPECAEEYLLAFSCKTRELCPSYAARRSAATAVLLAEDVLKEVDPLVCPSCGGEMKVIAFIIDHQVVDKILRHLKPRHLKSTGGERGRPPPGRSEHAPVS